MLSGQRHAPHRPLKQLVRTDNMGAGMFWLGGREWVDERAWRKVESGGGAAAGGGSCGGGVENTMREEGIRKWQQCGSGVAVFRRGRAGRQGWHHVTHVGR